MMRKKEEDLLEKSRQSLLANQQRGQGKKMPGRVSNNKKQGRPKHRGAVYQNGVGRRAKTHRAILSDGKGMKNTKNIFGEKQLPLPRR